jgi:Uncharacterised nucleotidyltransferase
VSFQARWDARRAMVQDAVLGEVVTAMHDRAVRPLLIKGVATARLLGQEPAQRRSADVDLLVAPSGLEAARAALRELGFEHKLSAARASERVHDHADEFVRGTPVPVSVDLHYSVARIPPSDAVFDALARGAEGLRIGRSTVDAPRAAACALIVALHASQHGVQRGRSIDDLERAIRVVPESTWAAAAELAVEVGAVGSFAFGLRLADAGPALADRLGAHGPETPSDRLRSQYANDGPVLVAKLRGARGVRHAGVLLRDALLPSPAKVRAYHPELGAGRTRLAAHYLRRWCRVPRVLVQYVRAGGRRRADQTSRLRRR